MNEYMQATMHNPQQGRKVLDEELWPWAKSMMAAGHELAITIEPIKNKRSPKQNSTMWSCMQDLSDQVQWLGKKLTKEGWKNFITGHLDGAELVPNLDMTGFISLQTGKPTSKMTTTEITAVIDLAHAFGSEKGVVWSKTSLGRDFPSWIDLETGEIL